jgi:hypothetical protein
LTETTLKVLAQSVETKIDLNPGLRAPAQVASIVPSGARSPRWWRRPGKREGLYSQPARAHRQVISARRIVVSLTIHFGGEIDVSI